MADKPRANFLVRLSTVAAAATLLAAMFWLAHALDRAAFQYLHADNVLRRDWARMFRVCGYLPLWLLVAAALWMLDAVPNRALAWVSIRRAAWLAVNPALTGLLCEVLKIAVRRERPESALAADGSLIGDHQYVFRPWSPGSGASAGDDAWWSTGGLGFPSSHAGVAAGAAAALICLYPRAWPVWIGLPIGCVVTRLLDRAHYLSDCVGAMIGAALVAGALMPLFRRANQRTKA